MVPQSFWWQRASLNATAWGAAGIRAGARCPVWVQRRPAIKWCISELVGLFVLVCSGSAVFLPMALGLFL